MKHDGQTFQAYLFLLNNCLVLFTQEQLEKTKGEKLMMAEEKKNMEKDIEKWEKDFEKKNKRIPTEEDK